VRYWERPPGLNKEAFYNQIETVGTVYKEACALHEQGTHVVSTDEKTGIQAKERAQSTLPMKSGRIEYQEFEYKRHGTCCLIAMKWPQDRLFVQHWARPARKKILKTILNRPLT